MKRNGVRKSNLVFDFCPVSFLNIFIKILCFEEVVYALNSFCKNGFTLCIVM